jgi:hypothetical protein
MIESDKKCAWPGCDKDARVKGYCGEHYPMERKGRHPEDYCIIEFCTRPRFQDDLCTIHFRKKLTGKFTMVQGRFVHKVSPGDRGKPTNRS